MTTIALATCATLTGLDADDRPLHAELERLGVQLVPAVWNDPRVDWTAFDLVVVRSCWDYDEDPAAFALWIDALEAQSAPVWNPPHVLRWNLDKIHLGELEAQGVPIIPTVFVGAGEARTLADALDALDAEHAVVKPTISLSAHGTWRTSRGEAAPDEERWRAQLEANALMVQRFVPEIVTKGEWSLVHLDGTFAHACLKHPAPGDFRVQGELGGRRALVDVQPDLLAQAERALAAAPGPRLYSRVDGVVVGDRFLLMEIELIDPQLYLTDSAASARRFAAALSSRC